MFFFDKEHILISRIYQLHPASATTHALVAIWMHIAKKRRRTTKKEKSRYCDQFLITTALTQPKQHLKSSFSKSDASK
jgi:hypothetical protein